MIRSFIVLDYFVSFGEDDDVFSEQKIETQTAPVSWVDGMGLRPSFVVVGFGSRTVFPRHFPVLYLRSQNHTRTH